MDINDQISLSHLLLNERTCRYCGQRKNLIEGFYRTRKNKGAVSSSYSYECKECTKKRIIVSRMTSRVFDRWEYPDW